MTDLDRYDQLLERLVASERRNRLLTVFLLSTIVVSTLVIAFPVYNTQTSLEQSILDHRKDAEGHSQRTENVHAEQSVYLLCIAKLSGLQQLENTEALTACAKQAKDSFAEAQGLPGQPQTRNDNETPQLRPDRNAPPQPANPQPPPSEGLIPNNIPILGGL